MVEKSVSRVGPVPGRCRGTLLHQSVLGDDIDNPHVGGGAADEVVDLRGRTLLPGFIDAHGHFPGSGMGAIAADLNSPPIGKINTMAVKNFFRCRNNFFTFLIIYNISVFQYKPQFCDYIFSAFYG